MAVIQTSGLTKFYGRGRGIEDLDLEVRKGGIFGFLVLLGRFHRGDFRERQDYLARCLDLDLKRPIRGYSRGMKQKLAVIQALRHHPDLLNLDEPTLGLDPLVQREFYTLLIEEKARGRTVFLSSHILPEVERVADRVGIVREVQLVAVEPLSSLKKRARRRLG